jgi:hypothetical protein
MPKKKVRSIEQTAGPLHPALADQLNTALF